MVGGEVVIVKSENLLDRWQQIQVVLSRLFRVPTTRIIYDRQTRTHPFILSYAVNKVHFFNLLKE